MTYNQNPYYGGYYQPNYYQNNGAIPDMLNQQKMAYQQPIQMPQQQMTATSPSNDIIWVLNEVEAQSYPVAPNNTVILFDKSNPTIYVKTNSQGMPSMRTLDFVERPAGEAPKQPLTHECQCGNKCVSKEDFEALKEELEVLKGKVSKTIKKVVEPIVKESEE